jgi:hypothetical protein
MNGKFGSVMPAARVLQYKDALLNTCVRLARQRFEAGTLTLSNCLTSDDFKETVMQMRLFDLPLLASPIEPAMKAARAALIREFTIYQPAA